MSILTKYHPEVPQEAYYLAMAGFSDEDMAKFWGVTETTISIWKREHPDFAKKVKEGRHSTNMEVLRAFYKSCVGYDYEEDEVHSYKGVHEVVRVKKHQPGDKWAQLKWLSLRMREHWSETQRIEINRTNTNINIDLSKLDTKELLIAKKLGIQNMFPVEDAQVVSPKELPDELDEDSKVA